MVKILYKNLSIGTENNHTPSINIPDISSLSTTAESAFEGMQQFLSLPNPYKRSNSLQNKLKNTAHISPVCPPCRAVFSFHLASLNPKLIACYPRQQTLPLKIAIHEGWPRFYLPDLPPPLQQAGSAPRCVRSRPRGTRWGGLPDSRPFSRRSTQIGTNYPARPRPCQRSLRRSATQLTPSKPERAGGGRPPQASPW